MVNLAYGQQGSYDRFMALGDSSYEAFDNALALEYYDSALNLDSNRYEIRLKLARTSYDYGLDKAAEGDDKKARKHFEMSIRHASLLTKFYPDSARSYILLAATTGNMAMFTGGREKVLLGRQVETYSKKAIDLDSTLAHPYVALGIYYREVSRLNWLERGIARMFFGLLPAHSDKEILGLLHRAEHLRPDFPFLQYELGMTYATLERYDQAIAHLERLQALRPETTQDRRNQQNSAGIIDELRHKQLIVDGE